MIDVKALAVTLLDEVKEWVAPAFEKVRARLDSMDAAIKAIPAGAKGDPGESIKGDPGKDADDDAILSRLEKLWFNAYAGINEKNKAESREQIRLLFEELPVPKNGENGKDAEVDYDRIGVAIKEVVEVAVAEIPKPVNGKDADPELIKQLVAAEVAKATNDFHEKSMNSQFELEQKFVTLLGADSIAA